MLSALRLRIHDWFRPDISCQRGQLLATNVAPDEISCRSSRSDSERNSRGLARLPVLRLLMLFLCPYFGGFGMLFRQQDVAMMKNCAYNFCRQYHFSRVIRCTDNACRAILIANRLKTLHPAQAGTSARGSMENQLSPAPGFAWQRGFIRLLDAAFHVQLAETSMDWSPISRGCDHAG